MEYTFPFLPLLFVHFSTGYFTVTAPADDIREPTWREFSEDAAGQVELASAGQQL